MKAEHRECEKRMSSAQRICVEDGKSASLLMSMIYTINRREPRMDSWKTPEDACMERN